VRLSSQSALQAHPAPDGAVAELRSTFEVEDDGRLECSWDPLIPFARAKLDHRIELSLADRAFLSWSDAMMAGRDARGERWRFLSLWHELVLSRGSSLEYLERYRIEPDRRAVSRRWLAGDASYLGTVLVSGELLAAGAAERLHDELGRIPGVDAACDQLNERLLVVRLMSASGPSFHKARLLAVPERRG
jgi:urease accessory protein